MECKYCNSSFSNKNALNTHQKTAKYCLTLRNEKPENYNCTSCGKTFSREHHLTRHIEICKIDKKVSKKLIYLENEINNYKLIFYLKTFLIKSKEIFN